MYLRTFVAGVVLAAASAGGFAQDKVINLYSARHYQADEALYSNFTKATGIRINRVDGDDAGTLARLKSEGAASPADVILLVDAARLWRAENDGLFQPVKSDVLESRIPVKLRGKDDGHGSQWFGFSMRARTIVYNRQTVKPEDVDSYEALADPKNKGKLCTRSGIHPYNVSLFGALYEHFGEARTEAILRGMVANMARPPVGSDTDQIRAVASGECGVAVSNSYYVARLMKSTRPEDIAVVSRIGVVWPNQKTYGVHVNIAGAGVAKYAPHKADAVKFLEYLSSDEAQRYFAEGNNEWPAVKGLKTSNAALDKLGTFKAEVIDVATIGRNQQKVLQILDRVGYR